MVVEGWLTRGAASRGRYVAVEAPEGSLTYSELLEAARAGAAELAAGGVGRGDRVAIALPGGLAFAQALHACLLLGAVAVPVDVRGTAAEGRRLAAGSALLIEEPLTGTEARPADFADASHALEAVAVVIHTSGTTSEPRAIELTYGNLLWSALGSAVALGVAPGDRWLCPLPVSHVGGLSILVRSAIYATTAVVHERFDAERVARALRREQITLVSLVATTLERLLDAGVSDPPALRCALTGGGPVPAQLVARARDAGVAVSLTYGLTEACSQVTTTPLAAQPCDGATGGPPLFCTRVRIAGEGETGEILVAGPTVARGCGDEQGWLHTGDIGALDELGRLHVSGRRSDTIVTGGENVAPAEVEAVLQGHPGVLEAAVLGRADERWGEAVTAIVVARPDTELDESELRALCARELAPYKVPKRVLVSRRRLPRTSSGKLLRRELR